MMSPLLAGVGGVDICWLAYLYFMSLNVSVSLHPPYKPYLYVWLHSTGVAVFSTGDSVLC